MSGACLLQRFVKKCQIGWPAEVRLPESPSKQLLAYAQMLQKGPSKVPQLQVCAHRPSEAELPPAVPAAVPIHQHPRLASASDESPPRTL